VRAVLAHVSAACETVAAWPGGEPPPDRCYVAHGTGGTFAGLALGFAAAGWPTEVVGVRVADLVVSNRWLDGHWIRGAVRWLRRGGAALPRRLPVRAGVDGRFFGGGYGRPTPEGA
jgi:D-cysteine desulfhydrase